jgi:hypothetical protein
MSFWWLDSAQFQDGGTNGPRRHDVLPDNALQATCAMHAPERGKWNYFGSTIPFWAIQVWWAVSSV